MPTRRIALLLLLTALLVCPAAAHALALAPMSGLNSPIFVTAPPRDERVFVVERGGAIRGVRGALPRATPFLTVPNVDTDGERGLLSMAFAPDYATSGLLYGF